MEATMSVFGVPFEVKLISQEDRSTKDYTDKKVVFSANGETYHYAYSGGGLMKLSSVHDDDLNEVYSPWRHIPNGSYYEEIGRRLSVGIHITPPEGV